jgi:hypothetical protein
MEGRGEGGLFIGGGERSLSVYTRRFDVFPPPSPFPLPSCVYTPVRTTSTCTLDQERCL